MSLHQTESLLNRRLPARSFTIAAGGRKGSATIRSVAICARRSWNPGCVMRNSGTRAVRSFSSTTFWYPLPPPDFTTMMRLPPLSALRIELSCAARESVLSGFHGLRMMNLPSTSVRSCSTIQGKPRRRTYPGLVVSDGGKMR